MLKEDGMQDRITQTEIEQFRKGNFKDADPNVKRKWCHVMLHFLPCVCSGYHKWDIKMNTPISQVTHATDEALVTWFLKCYIADWDKMYAETLQIQDQENANKRRRKEGKHKSSEELGEYLDLHASIKLARNEKGKGWDDAVMLEARLQNERINNMALPDSIQNAPTAYQVPKKTYVMLFSDNDDDDLPSQDGNETDSTQAANITGV